MCEKRNFKTVCGRQFKLGGFPVEYLLGGGRGRSPLGGLGGALPPLGFKGAEPPLRLRIREAVTAYISLYLINGHRQVK